MPAAVTFASLGGFSDVQGIGIATEYMAQRDGTAGTSGWTTHGIFPPQSPLSYLGVVKNGEPNYEADMASDLTAGVFHAWSPLTDAPNVAHTPNLYRRDDLRSSGAGSYQLLSDAVAPLPLPTFGTEFQEQVAATSTDFQHVLFETRLNLTSDASGGNVKLYKSDNGVTRLVAAGPSCSGSPCSMAGRGASSLSYTDRTLSSDGRRVTFTTPTSGVTELFQLDDHGTASTADDVLVQIDASEASVPDATQPATFETASTDGSRVFFLSSERLTTDAPPGGGLYMWERQPTNEEQSVAVDATGGTFTLTAHAEPSHGTGTLANGSTDVENVAGAFFVGQTISGPGIAPGTTVVDVPSSTSLTLSTPATADGDTTISASIDATTGPLPYDATAAQVQSALEGLGPIGAGNVDVSGGPGGGGGATPYVVTFTGGLAGVEVAQMLADGSSLTGGGASATVTVTKPLKNLKMIAATLTDPTVAGTIGVSDDGHRLYFASFGAQLVSGGPPVSTSGIYYWQDADGTPAGTLSFIGEVEPTEAVASIDPAWGTLRRAARITPNGQTLVFEVSDGSGLAPRYDSVTHCITTIFGNANNTSAGCSEVYVYQADGSTPTRPNLVCASCNPSGAPGTATAWLNVRFGAGATTGSSHVDHVLSDDGRYVFFSTAEALIPEDVNGKIDAYEYDTTTGRVHLLSTGTDTSDSYVLDAGANGHDVYLLTRQQLVGWDTDNAYDLYDARVDGGFPDPPTPPIECSGDACQGAVPSAPALPVAGSVSFRGGGDARAVLRARRKALRCKRGYGKRRVRGKVRCVRKPKHKRKPHAATKRRGK